MLREKDIKKIIKKRRLNLSLSEYFLHYSAGIGIFIVPIINAYFLILYFFSGEKEKLERVTEEIEFPFLLLIISVGIFIKKYKSLEFEKYNIKIDNEKFNRVIQLTSEELNWNKVTQNENYYQGLSESNLIGFGEKVTIVKNKNFILINSIENPNNWWSNFSFGGNRKNKKTFEKNLKASVQQRV